MYMIPFTMLHAYCCSPAATEGAVDNSCTVNRQIADRDFKYVAKLVLYTYSVSHVVWRMRSSCKRIVQGQKVRRQDHKVS